MIYIGVRKWITTFNNFKISVGFDLMSFGSVHKDELSLVSERWIQKQPKSCYKILEFDRSFELDKTNSLDGFNAQSVLKSFSNSQLSLF